MKRSPSSPAAARIVVSSSPGRAEKLPMAPGLARLLRGKSGSRSRSRARSIPMFASRSRSSAAEAAEPSSPKVTCIGQVRIRNKKTKSTPASSSKKPNPQPKNRPMNWCRCIERALLCKIFRRSPSPIWRRWSLSRRSDDEGSYKQKTAAREESDLGCPPPRGSESEGSDEETRGFMPPANLTPPRNALLLMRCGSAPNNRSSTLTVAGDPPPPAPGSPAGEELGAEDHRGSSMNGRDEAGMWSSGSSPAHLPMVLTRCKSEPAKAAEKLVGPEKSCGPGGCTSGGGEFRLVGEGARLSLLQPPY